MSSGFALELQKGLRAALVADSSLTALVAARVYDEPPQAPKHTHLSALAAYSRVLWTKTAEQAQR